MFRTKIRKTMALSWNEIKERSIQFSKEWENETKENAEAKSFWDSFFNVFGISRRRVASFEHAVKKHNGKQGFIDLFWKGTLIVEHKSKGKNLNRAYEQAIDYFPGLSEDELPKYILVSDFENFRLYDLEENTQHDFLISEFYKNIKLFGFISGYKKQVIREEDPINIRAAEKMGKLHDLLKENGYEGHELEVYLVRLLFVLFADKTLIFEKDTFWNFIDNYTAEDGRDLGMKMTQLFQVLDKPKNKRQTYLDETFTHFPYINGRLFEEVLQIAAFDKKMREILLECCALDWSKISPAIFGSIFQSIMDKQARRNLGAHYTSEKNILKLIKPLFLDKLWEEFEKVKGNSKRLAEFHKKLGSLCFFDPACGSGNFLIIAYRELRLLELEILKILYKRQKVTTIDSVIWINIDQFYGIEIDEWAARIAEVAMWLIDHQMNLLISENFGKYFARIPIKKSANILLDNSLQVDWTKFAPKRKINYILGNPPFIGKYLQTEQQKKDLEQIITGIKGAGVLDYVAAWYLKAAKYIQKTEIKVAFVSTNSISQGEQVGILWNEMFNKYRIKIHFAHRTFRWDNEASGKAAVHVIIVGFANFDIQNKLLFDYEDIKSDEHKINVKNINPYLLEGKDIVVLKQRNSICNAKPISFGSMPNDGGNFIFTDKEKEDFLKKEPEAKEFIFPLISAREFLNNKKRWCLWLKNIKPHQINNLKEINKRVLLVKKHREKSKRETTRKLALTPILFGENRQPETNYILIPRHSSENRKYIPLGFLDKNNIASDSCLTVSNATFFEFGILTSEMHMIWIKYTCGRLKSDYRYSNEVVYNNFPFPKELKKAQKTRVEKAAQLILDIQEKFKGSSLADLYNPISMPPELVKAHQKLDKAVDLCYRPQVFRNERNRIEFLFDLYSQYVTPLQAAIDKEEKKKTKNKK